MVLLVFCMGLVVLLLFWFGCWLVEYCGIVCGLLVIVVVCFWCLELDSGLVLIVSVVLVGSGVVIIQVLVLGVVKCWFLRWVLVVMGFYLVLLMVGGGIVVVFSLWIVEYFFNWQVGFGVWVVLVLLVLLLWMFVWLREVLLSVGEGLVWYFFGNCCGWLLVVYFGLINGGYISMVVWLLVYYCQFGWSVQDSGGLVGIMIIFQVFVVFSVLLLICCCFDCWFWLLVVLLVQFGGFCGLLLMLLQYVVLWVVLIGYGLGVCFVFSLILIFDYFYELCVVGSLVVFV